MYGKLSLTLDFGLHRTFRWMFVIANIQHPILCSEFLCHFSLLIDMRNHQLLDELTALQVQGIKCSTKSPSPATLPRKPLSIYDTLLAKFPYIIQPCISDSPMKHNVTHQKLEAQLSLLLPGVLALTASTSQDRISIICWSWGW